MENTRLNPLGSAEGRNQRPALELRTLGGYRLLRRLGEGGMGAVYLGYKEGEEQPVAIKILAEHLVETPGFVARFQREARNGATLNHPHIIRTYLVDRDPETGKHFLVLEFVDGPSAQALLDRLGCLTVGDAAYIVLGVARALEHAHSQRIIHRDIKPDNILLTRDFEAKLADLGLAKKLDDATHLTATRQGFGTTPYMPYEQAINARYADVRSDIYALGATFYHLVTGVLPFTGLNDLEVIEKKKQGDYTPARFHVPALPARLDGLLDRMLARDPGERFQSAADLIAALEGSGLVPAQPGFAACGKPDSDVEMPTIVAGGDNAPTRINLEIPPAVQPPVRPGVWDLRYRNRKGRLCKGRATTTQIVERLQKGQMPAGVEARGRSQKGFHPLAFYPEFQVLMTSTPAVRKLLRAKPPKEKEPGNTWLLLLAAGGLLVGLLAGAAALGCLKI